MMSHANDDKSRAPSPRRWLTRRGLLLGGAVLIVAVSIFGRGFLAWGTRQLALQRLNVGAISTAEQWLAWSAWFNPADGRTDLLKAACYRQRYEEGLWKKALESAERHEAPDELIRREQQLGAIQAGTFREEVDELSSLVESGASPDSVCTAFLHGYLVRKDAVRAEMVLSAWETENADSTQLAFMRGVFWQWQADAAGDLGKQEEFFRRAEEAFRTAVALEPRHEPARKALADLLEDQDRLDEAHSVYAALVAQAPANESAKLGLARVLRGLGAHESARAVLESLGASLETSAVAASEMGQVALELGDYEDARRWIALAKPDTTADADTLRAAATARAVRSDTVGAERLLTRLDWENSLVARRGELLTRLATGPHDPKAEEELRHLSSGSLPVLMPNSVVEAGEAAPASDLYLQQCSGCHGESGDGKGRGSRHLFPRARDFRNERFRLASTVNGIPSLEDVASVIERGMPGISMPAFDKLTEEERFQLAREVFVRRREGVRDQAVQMLREQGEEIDEQEIEQIVELCTAAGENVGLPLFGSADSRAIARGKDTYFALGCNNCHGDDGTGVWSTPLYDEQQQPSSPRDLTHDPLKGGDDPESIYLRIVVGMPGTPHPSAANVAEEDLVDLVHFCRSLFQDPKRVQTNHERAVEVSRRYSGWTTKARPTNNPPISAGTAE